MAGAVWLKTRRMAIPTRCPFLDGRAPAAVPRRARYTRPPGGGDDRDAIHASRALALRGVSRRRGAGRRHGAYPHTLSRDVRARRVHGSHVVERVDDVSAPSAGD